MNMITTKNIMLTESDFLTWLSKCVTFLSGIGINGKVQYNF